MSKENSFDIACKVDTQEVNNAVHQTLKEIRQRFDFKDSKTRIDIEKEQIVILTENEFRLRNIIDIMESRMFKRGVPIKALSYEKIEDAAQSMIRQRISIQQGIPTEKAKEIIKLIKELKLKVQGQIQEDQVRIFGKNKDDLQVVIKMLKEKDLGIEMQFINYR